MAELGVIRIMFVMTTHVCHDKTFVATEYFCYKPIFVATKDMFCHDRNDTCGSSRQ